MLFIHFNVHTWHTRQRYVWQQPPTASQEDFIFHNMLRSLSVSDKLLDEPLIPYWPDSFHIPGLIRFLAGVEDFACPSAHYTLRSRTASRNVLVSFVFMTVKSSWTTPIGTCCSVVLLRLNIDRNMLPP